VALEISQMVPLRVANLAALEVGKHLVFVGAGRQEHAVIALPSQIVKNDTDLEYPLPPESTRLIRRYVGTFPPLIAPPGSTNLFPGQGGRPKRPATLAKQATAVIRRRVGHRIHFHLLRHFAALLYLGEFPGRYEGARRLLGHKGTSTAIDAYAGSEQAAAARQFDEVVLRLRREAGAVRRPPPPGSGGDDARVRNCPLPQGGRMAGCGPARLGGRPLR
jgi:integrase